MKDLGEGLARWQRWYGIVADTGGVRQLVR